MSIASPKLTDSVIFTYRVLYYTVDSMLELCWKVFLMLRQETAGYALGKRPPWGSCVMEIKNGQGRLQLTVQGLRRGVYGVYVMLGENPAETAHGFSDIYISSFILYS